MDGITNILISGVGGQGIILAATIISDIAFEAGNAVLKNEIHGMSQRGGDVTSHIRFGREVYAPTIEPGRADYILSFEWLEALRVHQYLKRDGVCIVNSSIVEPAPVKAGLAAYPSADSIRGVFSSITNTMIITDGESEVKKLGNPRGVNIFLLGVLSKHLTIFPEELWIESIRRNVKPDFVEKNIECFTAGRAL
jgi:indolepyruvate ferredoxin oxidoreductase, beta subunit